MKTSFYFFLWFIVYILIDLTGIPALINNSFLTAWIFVFLVGKGCDKLFEKENMYQINLNRQFIFEIFYNNQPDELAKVVRRQFFCDTILTTYCIVTIVGLFAFGAHDYFAYIIFGIFGILSAIRSSKEFNRYRSLKENGLPTFNESEFAYDEEAYEEYSRYRPEYTPDEMAPEAPKMSKWLNVISVLFAVLCTLGGLIYTVLIIGAGTMDFMLGAMLIWATMAIYFGLKDCITSIQILRGKPIPSLK